MFIFVVIVFLFWIIFAKWQTRKIRKLSGHSTSKYVAVPLLGHAYKLLWSTGRMDCLKEFGNEAIENGGIIGVWFGWRYCTVICDAVISEAVLKSCFEKAKFLNLVHDLLGNGSIFAPVNIWRPRRKLILPTFAVKNLRRFMPVFFRRSNNMVDQLKPMVSNGSISILKYLSYYSMGSICETVLGEHLQDDGDTFLNAFETFCRLSSLRMSNPFLHCSAIFRLHPCYKEYWGSIKALWKFVDKIIETKRGVQAKTCNDSKNDRTKERIKSFLEMLVDKSDMNGLTNDELREEILVLAIAGTDTSATSSSFVSTMLSHHPDIQEKLYNEIYSIFGESNAPFTMEDIFKLKYLDAVVKETLRLYPPAPSITRELDKDLKLPSGITLMKGTFAFFNIWSLHRNPRYWGHNAEEFNPDRFLNGSTYHPCAFLPFSWGPRNCLGYQYALLSIKTAVINLVRNYKLLPPTSSLKNESLNLTLEVILRDSNGFQLQVEERHH